MIRQLKITEQPDSGYLEELNYHDKEEEPRKNITSEVRKKLIGKMKSNLNQLPVIFSIKRKNTANGIIKNEEDSLRRRFYCYRLRNLCLSAPFSSSDEQIPSHILLGLQEKCCLQFMYWQHSLERCRCCLHHSL
jgi:hypothetical protein